MMLLVFKKINFVKINVNSLLEFVPYVLQIIGFLLESHSTTTIPDGYRSLFQLILTPSFWDRSGNIPALSRHLQAYIEKAGETIVMEKLVRSNKILVYVVF
jgi:exportin-2 (importin alpha re-exporter)